MGKRLLRPGRAMHEVTPSKNLLLPRDPSMQCNRRWLNAQQAAIPR